MAIDIATLPELVVRSLDAGWNYARWSRLPDDGNRYEVIDGVLYMTTAPSYFHQWIIRQIVRALLSQIDDTGIGLTTWAPIGLLMPGCDPVQPDIVVVRSTDQGVIYDRRINGVPALIVEVLSPGNPEKDTEIKRAAYARAGLPEYWIVRPAERDVLVLSVPDPALAVYLQASAVGLPASWFRRRCPSARQWPVFLPARPMRRCRGKRASRRSCRHVGLAEGALYATAREPLPEEGLCRSRLAGRRSPR